MHPRRTWLFTTRFWVSTSHASLSVVVVTVLWVGAALSTAGAQERRPAEGPVEKPVGETKPAEPKAVEPKPVETKPVEPKNAETKTTQKKGKSAASGKAKSVRRTGPPTQEARLVEGGSLVLTLLDERVEFLTPYGRLSIPLSDVQRIEFATRTSQEIAEKIDKAIRDLGADEFGAREKASADLLALKERAYAAIAKAAEHSDPEVARRAEELLEKLREAIPEDRLTPRENDVVQTKDSKFTGKLVGDGLKVLTAQFGEQRLRFADVLSLGEPIVEAEPTASKNAIPNPGSLHAYQAMIGQTLTFRVTGNPTGSIWGTDMYTLDTQLATAAVHAGVLKPGETGDVKVQILGPQPAFMGSVRHGVSSSDYGAYPGAYRVLSSRKK
jgi:hypothetical protein